MSTTLSSGNIAYNFNVHLTLIKVKESRKYPGKHENRAELHSWMKSLTLCKYLISVSVIERLSMHLPS